MHIAPVALQMADAPARLGNTHHHKTWRTDPGRQDDTIWPYVDHTGRACDVLRSRLPALRSPSHQCGPRPPPPGRDTYVGYHRDVRRLARLRTLLDLVIERLEAPS